MVGNSVASESFSESARYTPHQGAADWLVLLPGGFPPGKIYLFSKGADDVMLPLLNDNEEVLSMARRQLKEMSAKGA